MLDKPQLSKNIKMRSSGHTFSSGVREKSPCRQKVEQLTEKLLEIGAEDDGKLKREQLVGRARSIYDRMEKNDANDDSRFKGFREQLGKIEGDLEEERAVRETFEEERRETIARNEKSFVQMVGEYRGEVLNRASHLDSKMDDRFVKIRGEIQQEQRKRNDATNESVRNLNDHLAELHGMIAAQRKNREDTYGVLIKQLGNDIMKLNDAITATRKAREESHSRVYRLIEDLQAKLVKEVGVSVKNDPG